MDLKLKDAVSKIVETNGVDILSTKRFWNILTDSYSFGNEYILKDTFKSCLKKGYISKLVANKGNAKKTKHEIDRIIIIETEKKREYSEILYIVAIAIGSCNNQDYLDFTNRNTPHTNPTPTPRPNKPSQKSNKSQPLIWKECLGILVIVFFGIIVSFGGTIVYSAFYYKGWWLSFIVLSMLLVQNWYEMGVAYLLNEFNSTSRYSIVVRSIISPLLIVMVLNALMSFLFFSETFRLWLGNYFSYFSNDIDEQTFRLLEQLLDRPTETAFIFCIFYVLSSIIGGLSCFNKDITSIKFSTHINKRINKRIFLSSSICVCIGYVILFCHPKIFLKWLYYLSDFMAQL